MVNPHSLSNPDRDRARDFWSPWSRYSILLRMERPISRFVAIGFSLAAGLFLSFCAFLLYRIAEGTIIPGAIVASPLAFVASPLLGLDRAIAFGFFLAPAYWLLLGWAVSSRSNRRALFSTLLLLGQYLGAAITVSLDLSYANESYNLQREAKLQPVVMGLFILVYLLAHSLFWYSVGPIRLANWHFGNAGDSSDGWWPRKPQN